MTHPSQRKGARAELEAAAIIANLTGWPARRKLGAGRADDTGDIDGVPDTVIQVKHWADVLTAIRTGVDGATEQQHNAGATFGAAMVRLRGGRWVICMSPEQWATYAREAAA